MDATVFYQTLGLRINISQDNRHNHSNQNCPSDNDRSLAAIIFFSYQGDAVDQAGDGIQKPDHYADPEPLAEQFKFIVIEHFISIDE